MRNGLILNSKINEVTIASIDAVTMYPSIKFSSSEENIFTFHKKLTKNTTIYCKIVPETHFICDEFYSTDI